MKSIKIFVVALLFLPLLHGPLYAENGYRLWLRYELVTEARLLTQYRKMLDNITVAGNSPTMQAASHELHLALGGLLGKELAISGTEANGSSLVVSTPANSAFIRSLKL
ncbi:MAG: alpha-glucuronidase, partial [Bacteroidetes bacterium]|nr:alpha-glucuronidase [Bacteroidota bacterium]